MWRHGIVLEKDTKMLRYQLYRFSKWVKYGGFLACIISLFSDQPLFSYLSFLSLFLVLQFALSCSVFFCSIALLLGLIVIRKRYGGDLPSVDTFVSSVAYDLPFEGAWAVVNGGITEQTSHAWNIPVERYAYDFLHMRQGRSYCGDERKPESYYCYGKTILAPADGVVVKVKDKWTDSLLFGNGRFFSLSGHVAGNSVLIKHAEGEYSFMAHLKKDSILVHKGDHVLRGQKIAQCGNTGNSTEPHLHFHLQNGKSFYTSVGLPIRFSALDLQSCEQYSQMDSRPVMPSDRIPKGYISRGYIVQNTARE